MNRRRKNSAWKNLFKKTHNYSDEESESEYEQQYQHHQQYRAEESATSLRHNQQIQHEIEKRLAIIETQMDEIRQILSNNQGVLPAPRTRPNQTVSLSRATGRRSRAQQPLQNFFGKKSKGTIAIIISPLNNQKIRRLRILGGADTSSECFFSPPPDARHAEKPPPKTRSEAGTETNGGPLSSHCHPLNQAGG